MKIIGRSNFDLETVDDILIAENVNSYYGKVIVDLLIKYDTHDNDTYFPRLVEDNYELYEWQPYPIELTFHAKRRYNGKL